MTSPRPGTVWSGGATTSTNFSSAREWFVKTLMAATAAVAPLSSTTPRIDAMGSDDGDDGFVMNLAGMEDAGGDDSERRGNPRKRTVMRAARKGRHRGWLGGKSADGAAKPGARPAGRGPGRGSGARGGGREGGGRGRGGGRGG